MAVTVETAVEQLVSALKEMRTEGHNVPAQLGFMKAKLYDESFLLRSDRNQVLKKVTRQLGVSWSMSQIKNANIETTETGETLIVAEDGELKGSVSVNIGGLPSSTAFAGLGVKVEDEPKAEAQPAQSSQDHKHLDIDGETTDATQPIESSVKGIDVSDQNHAVMINNCKKFLAESGETFESIGRLDNDGWALTAIDKDNNQVVYNFTPHGNLLSRGYPAMADQFIDGMIEDVFSHVDEVQPEQLLQVPNTEMETPREALTRAIAKKGISVCMIMECPFGEEGGHFVLGRGFFGAENKPGQAVWFFLHTNREHEVIALSQPTEAMVEHLTEVGYQYPQNKTKAVLTDFGKAVTAAFPHLTEKFNEFFKTTYVSESFIETQLDLPAHRNPNFRPLRPVITIGDAQTKNSNTQPEGKTAMNDNIPQNLKSKFEGFLQTLGATPEEREAFIRKLLESSETYRDGYATFKVTNANLNEVETLFLFAEQNPEVAKVIVDMAAEKHLVEEGLKHVKSRFSLTGETDEAGPRGSWIGFGAAVVGGGIEMFARDGATVGAAIGTLGAAVGSFIGGELVDKHIENRLGRYVAAGMLGLGAGSLGSAIGRNLITGVQLPDFIVARDAVDGGAAVVVSDADL